MLKKFLASVGIGAAKVDTILQTEYLQAGQTFQAEIVITGGDVAQELSGLELALMTQAKQETDNGSCFVNHVIEQWHLSDRITLQAGEVVRLPFSEQLHPETPVTELPTSHNQCDVWLATGLNIDMAVDASDRDTLYIHPNEAMQRCMAFMEEAGFHMAKADVEKGFLQGSGFRSHSGIYQELEYRPSSFGLFGVKEVELSFIPDHDQTHLLIELDRAFRGDSYLSLTIPHTADGLNCIPQQLKQLLY